MLCRFHRKRRKERKACYAFYLSNSIHVAAPLIVFFLVFADIANTLRPPINKAYYYFEKSLWYDNHIRPYRLMLLMEKHWTTNNIYISILLCPTATRHLYLVP